MRRLRFWSFALVAAIGLAAPLAPGSAQARPIQCGSQCQLAWQQQRADALPRTRLYDAPDPLPWGPLGQLIRQETVSAYQVQGIPVTATRIMYRSHFSMKAPSVIAAVLRYTPTLSGLSRSIG